MLFLVGDVVGMGYLDMFTVSRRKKRTDRQWEDEKEESLSSYNIRRGKKAVVFGRIREVVARIYERTGRGGFP